MIEGTSKTWDADVYGPFVDESSGPLDDLVASLLDDPDTAREYLRSTFLTDTMAELRRLRIGQGVTQAELGERIGAHQSAVARLERRDDISLSRLWDYLYALGMAPFAMEWGSFTKVVECVRIDPGHRVTSDHFHSRIEPETIVDVLDSLKADSSERAHSELAETPMLGTGVVKSNSSVWIGERLSRSGNSQWTSGPLPNSAVSSSTRIGRSTIGKVGNGNAAPR